MKLCFCRFLFAAAIIVIALVWWPASWAKIVVIIAAVLLAIMSLFYQKCFCRAKKAEPVAEAPPPAPPEVETPGENE
jgi:hypothetical protein